MEITLCDIWIMTEDISIREPGEITKITVCLNNGSTTIDLREYLGKGSVLLSESYEAGKLGSMGYAIIEEK